METSPIDDVKFESSSTRTTTYVIVSSSGAITGAIDTIEDDNHDPEEIDAEEMSSPRSMERVHSTQQTHTVLGHVVTAGEDDDKTSSTTVSTLEASSSGLAGTFDESGGFRLENDLNGNGDDNDIASLHGDGSNVNIEWLNNQCDPFFAANHNTFRFRMQVAINSGVLDVTCKTFHGQLHLDKFGSGNRGKCIFAYNQWFTPSEFEAFCGRAQCKDWKRSIKFQDRSLLQLIELDILRVHAVSCTCGSCWNGESEGPVRYHDVKRKSSSVHPSLAGTPGLPQTATKRLYTHSTTRPVLNEHHYADGSPPSKQLKIEVPSTAGQIALSGTLVQSPGGTLRLLQTSQQQQQSQSGSATVVSTASQSTQSQLSTSQSTQQQTLALFIPGKGGQSKQIIVNKPTGAATSGSTSNTNGNGQQGIPLGITYAPLHIVNTNPVTTLASSPIRKTATSSGIFADFAILEESVQSLQSHAASLRSQIKSLRVQSERTISELTSQLTAERESGRRAREQQQHNGSGEQPKSNHQKLCINCNHSATLTCAACQRVFYCGEFCVRKDALNHRDQCVPRTSNVETVNID